MSPIHLYWSPVEKEMPVLMTTGNTFKISFSLASPWKFPLYGLPLRCSVSLHYGDVTG